jgi:FKBP-type peptidyl-prolyl cis-trans isomerase
VVDAVKEGDTIKTISIARNGAPAEAFRPNQASFDSLEKAASRTAAEKLRAGQKADIAKIEAKYPKASKSASGIWYVVNKQGKGNKPKKGQKIKANYRLTLLSGQLVDASDMHGGPIEFNVGTGQVIPGWDEMLLDMRPGEKRTLVVPPELGYGEDGADNGVIPPNSFLEFEVELLNSRANRAMTSCCCLRNEPPLALMNVSQQKRVFLLPHCHAGFPYIPLKTFEPENIFHRMPDADVSIRHQRPRRGPGSCL